MGKAFQKLKNAVTAPFRFVIAVGNFLRALVFIIIFGLIVLLVLSIKYETSGVVGSPEPGTVHYDYSTLVDGLLVDRDLDGVYLKKK